MKVGVKKSILFLSLPKLKIEKIWLPIFQAWLKTELEPQQVIHLAVDRTKWECINLLTVSLIWEKRALPIYWELLPKQGNSNFEQQITVISKIIPLLAEYKIVVLGNARILFSETGELAVRAESVLLPTS